MSDEAEIREVLSETFTPEGVEVWMTGRHRLLGGRPIDLIAAGEGERVMQMACAMRDGTFL